MNEIVMKELKKIRDLIQRAIYDCGNFTEIRHGENAENIETNAGAITDLADVFAGDIEANAEAITELAEIIGGAE